LFLTLVEIKALTDISSKQVVINLDNGNAYTYNTGSTSEPDDLSVIKPTSVSADGRFLILTTGVIAIAGTPESASVPVSINGMRMYDSSYLYISAGTNQWYKSSLERL